MFTVCKSSISVNSKHVVFGEVIRGSDIVDAIENQEVDAKHRPLSDVRISNCGELVLQLKSKFMTHQMSENEIIFNVCFLV